MIYSQAPTFFRPKVKPRMYGPASQVQSSIFKNADREGYDPGSIALAMPMWGPGDQLDYANLVSFDNTGAPYSNGKLTFPNDNTTIELRASKNASYLAPPYTIVSRFAPSQTAGARYCHIIAKGSVFSNNTNFAFAFRRDSQKLAHFWRNASNALTGGEGGAYALTLNRPVTAFVTVDSVFDLKIIIDNAIYFADSGNAAPINVDRAITVGAPGAYVSNDLGFSGDIFFAYIFKQLLNSSQIAHLSDNPYFLLHRQPSVFYSVPEIGIISAACSDGFTFADTATKTAILQAAAAESINLSDSDENVAQFIAALVDSFTITDSPVRTATYPVSVSDAFSVADTTTALQKVVALVSDSVTFSDVSVVRADLAGVASDNVQFSETLVATLQAQAIAAEIINLSDTATSRADLTAQATDDFTVSAATTADVLGVLSGLCSDTFNVSDTATSRADLLAAVADALGLSDVASALLIAQAQVADSFTLDDESTWASIAAALVADGFTITGEVTCRADLVAALVDSMTLSDTAAAILTAYATAADGFTVSDTAFWAGIVQAIASDSFTVSGSVTGLIKLLAQAAETINFSDSGSVTATYNVQVNDAVEFATAISTIAQLRAAVADGFNVTATPMEVSQLPNGKVSVSFSMKVPGADFSMKTATVVFNIK